VSARPRGRRTPSQLTQLPPFLCRLSNIGTIGGTYASPIIPANTAVIGALGKITKLPRYASTLPGARKAAHGEEDALVPVHIMTVSWAADHRFVDGATIARFTRRWKELIEAPAAMLVEMR
jgi:2-oxoisovalerate dehydrogenase E2 component (dihydrolipoyl transacylase)